MVYSILLIVYLLTLIYLLENGVSVLKLFFSFVAGLTLILFDVLTGLRVGVFFLVPIILLHLYYSFKIHSIKIRLNAKLNTNHTANRVANSKIIYDD
ncbi:MAG: hypothetical protein KatS3mg101_0927 [Patescibacteria group bacterium]|nr:MAG: hypothetical protein KatS3mg101_0927 [Patescibacteria group bacterium]